MRSESRVLRRLRRYSLALSTVFVLTLSHVDARADEAVRAVWQVQEVNIPYFGFTTYYSCDGLRDKLRTIFSKLEVREDFLVTVTGCTELSGPERNLSASVIFARAVPASDEVAQAFAKDPKRAQLLARLQKRAKTPISDQPFDAVYKRVNLNVKERPDVGSSGDCELIEQIARDVVPKIGAKVVKDEVMCAPNQGVVGNPKIVVEVLAPVERKS